MALFEITRGEYTWYAGIKLTNTPPPQIFKNKSEYGFSFDLPGSSGAWCETEEHIRLQRFKTFVKIFT